MADTKKEPNRSHKLYRSEANKIIAGISGGLGEYFNTDPVIIRLAFILLTVFGGWGVIIYLVLWLIIPTKSQGQKENKETIRTNAHEIKVRVQELRDEIRQNSRNGGSRPLFGLLLIIFGAIFLLDNFGFLHFINISALWPLILVFAGLAILM